MLFFLFFLPPLQSPITPILSLLSLPPFPLSHLLLLADFNSLPCSSSPSSRLVEMHGKCTARYLSGIPHVRDMCDEPYPGPACKTFFKMDQSWCNFCILVCHPCLLLVSLVSLLRNLPLQPFYSPSLIPLTFISDPCFGIIVWV